MWWTWVLKLVTSKQGMIVVGVLVVLAMFAGYKWKISSLEGQLDRAKADNATMQIRNKICESDIGVLKNSVERQNGVIEDLQATNEILELEKSRRAEESFRSPEEVDRIVNEGSGPMPMNDFMEELFRGVI